MKHESKKFLFVLQQMPKGNDQSWAEKLYKACAKYKHFSRPRFGNSSFVIQHFADNVEYQVDGFLDKNRDSVMEEQINVLKHSQVMISITTLFFQFNKQLNHKNELLFRMISFEGYSAAKNLAI